MSNICVKTSQNQVIQIMLSMVQSVRRFSVIIDKQLLSFFSHICACQYLINNFYLKSVLIVLIGQLVNTPWGL